MTALVVHPARIVLLLITVAILLVTASSCDLPDFKGPDGWRTTSVGAR